MRTTLMGSPNSEYLKTDATQLIFLFKINIFIGENQSKQHENL